MNTINRETRERLTNYYHTLIEMNLYNLEIVDDLENIVINNSDEYSDDDISKISQEAVSIIYGDY